MAGTLIGYALTPGYETYAGLGGYGVVVQAPANAVPNPREDRARFGRARRLSRN